MIFCRNPLFSLISPKLFALGTSLLLAGTAFAQEPGSAASEQVPQTEVSVNIIAAEPEVRTNIQPTEPAQTNQTTAAPVDEHTVLTPDEEAKEITSEVSNSGNPLANTQPGTAKIEMLETGRVFKIEDDEAATKQPAANAGVAEVRNLETGEIAVIEEGDEQSPKIVETLGPVERTAPSQPQRGNN